MTSITGQTLSTIVNQSVLQQSHLMQEHIQLAVISIEMVKDSMSRYHATQWSGIEDIKKHLELTLEGLQERSVSRTDNA